MQKLKKLYFTDGEATCTHCYGLSSSEDPLYKVKKKQLETTVGGKNNTYDYDMGVMHKSCVETTNAQLECHGMLLTDNDYIN